MSLTDILFLSVALAMDCLTVSTASGVIVGQRCWRVEGRMSILFGLFQALMPLAGWAVTSFWSSHIETVSHWIAFILLTFIGMRMIISEDDEHPSSSQYPLSLQLTLAIATSIDALAVGITLAFTGYKSFSSLIFPLSVIGISSLFFSIFGYEIGLRFGNALRQRFRPNMLGGIILVLIGLKLLFNL